MAYCTKHGQYYNPVGGEFCPYCGPPQGLYGTSGGSHILDPCPKGGNHEWQEVLDCTGDQEKCPKCNQFRPKGSIYFSSIGNSDDELVIESNDQPKWPGLDFCKGEGSNGEHKFTISKKPGEDARCEYCKMKLYGDYIALRVKTTSKTGPGIVRPAYAACLNIGKGNEKGNDLIHVKLRKDAKKYVPQESMLTFWHKNAWVELHYIEFDGTTFMLADGVTLPTSLNVGNDLFVAHADEPSKKEEKKDK